MYPLIYIAIGGAAGALLRYSVSGYIFRNSETKLFKVNLSLIIFQGKISDENE